MIIIWIIVSIILFSIIVLIHEFWHFKAARIFWVKVEEFWLWIPPKAKKIFTDKKWTTYTLNWLPLWGFVRLKWENSLTAKNPEEKDNLMNISPWKQAIIMLAWVFMNFMLAFIIFSILFFIWVKPIWINTKIETNLNLKIIPNLEQALESGLLERKKWVVLYPIEWSVAEKSGIKEGDILLNISWKEVSTDQAMETISRNSWNELIFNIKRDNKKININITPLIDKKSEKWKIGSYLTENIIQNKDFEYKYWFFESIKYWALETYGQSILTFKALWILVRKLIIPKNDNERSEAIKQVSWPVWLVDFISNSISAWIMFLIILTAIISINLWVFNLLPIPALDWWRFLFITINWVINSLFWKKAINEKTEMLTNLIFFAFLIFLSIIVTYNDIIKIIEK